MYSAFGIDHGDISKAQQQPSTGRYITAHVAPGIHGAVAGKPGKKLRAAGSELGGSFVGGAAGVGGAIALRRSPLLAEGVAAGGGIAGSMLGTQHAQKRGYYKPQQKKKVKSNA